MQAGSNGDAAGDHVTQSPLGGQPGTRANPKPSISVCLPSDPYNGYDKDYMMFNLNLLEKP